MNFYIQIRLFDFVLDQASGARACCYYYYYYDSMTTRALAGTCTWSGRIIRYRGMGEIKGGGGGEEGGDRANPHHMGIHSELL